MHRNHRLLAGAAVLALAATTAGCGNDTDGAATAPAPASDRAPAPASDRAEDTVTVTLVDYAFEGLPSTIAGGTRLQVENAAADELHELVATRLPDGESRSATELAALPPEEFRELLAAGPATVLLAAPGEEQVAAFGDGTLTEPGRYLVFCAIPSGADPEEYLDAVERSRNGPPQGNFGGPPHFLAGMATDLTVT